MKYPVIINNDLVVYFYKNMVEENESQKISAYFKEVLLQIEHTDCIEVYKIEDYSIVTILLNGKEAKCKFYDYLDRYTYNQIPLILNEKFNKFENALKIVSLEMSNTSIIIKVLEGNIDFITEDKKFKNDIKIQSKNIYCYPKDKNYYLINKLSKSEVNIVMKSYDCNEDINISFNNKINLRYYQEQAINSLIKNKKGLLIMPSGSGKTFVGLGVMNYFKKVTLILCENRDNCIRWKEIIMEYTDVIEDDILLCIDKKNEISLKKINIISYDLLRKENIDIYKKQWGIVIYDNAHKVLTEKSIGLLYIKSEYKFAFDSTINRTDGKQASLLNIFGRLRYNININELINNRYLKILECYKLDIRKEGINKYDVIKKIINQNESKSIVVASFKNEEMKIINRNIGLKIIDSSIDNNERITIVRNFNNGKIKSLCIGILISNYFITNINIMIAIGYKGKTEIEDEFRIGTLISTKKQMKNVEIGKKIFLISDEDTYKKVNSKESNLKKKGVILKEIDLNAIKGVF